MSDELRARLRGRDPFGRLEAAVALARTGSDEGRDVLLRGLEHKDPMVRSRAAFLLGQIGPSWAIEPLATRLRDPVSAVRNEVVFALLGTRRAAAVPLLIRALEDPDPDRREDARVALVTLLGKPMAAVLAEMEEEVPDEAGQARAWWKANAARFPGDGAWDAGEPLSIERWIRELGKASPETVEILNDRLADWTGEDPAFGAEGQAAAAAAWRAWWRKHGSRFPAGRRYFWGRPVE